MKKTQRNGRSKRTNKTMLLRIKMKKNPADRIMQGLREAVAHARGEKVTEFVDHLLAMPMDNGAFKRSGARLRDAKFVHRKGKAKQTQ